MTQLRPAKIIKDMLKKSINIKVLQRSNTTSQSVYEEHFSKSIETPEEFWHDKAKAVNWFKPYNQILDNSNPPFTKWFLGGEMNTCYELIDRHVDEGFGDEIGMIYDSPLIDVKKKFTYKELQSEVGKFARLLIDQGVKKGDRVAIFMPMIPEALIAIHACTRIGAIHVVVFGGFASNELARRIDHCHPTILVTASCGIEPGKLIKYEPLVEKALEMSTHKPKKVITVDRKIHKKEKYDKNIDMMWEEAMSHVQNPHDYVPVDANDPLYILYTSGTTGVPKGIVRPSGGHAVALKYSMKHLFDANPSDVFWAASDIGWIVGHSYTVYAPFFNRSPSIVFEGKPVGSPDASTFFRMIEEYNVRRMITAPTTLRVIQNEDPDAEHSKRYDLDSLGHIFVAGENADEALLAWASNCFRSHIIDHWWQTETGWPITNHHIGLGLRSDYPLGTCGKPSPGFNVRVLNSQSEDALPGELGHVYVQLPLPPGTMSTVWNDDERFGSAYFSKEGLYDTSDAGIFDENGYLKICGRLDDIINVAGHRLSTKQMETVIEEHSGVFEAAVIAMHDDVKGLIPCGLVVKTKRCQLSDEDLKKELISLVRSEVGPVAAFKRVVFLPYLPKTRSAKIVRGVLKKVLDGEEFTVPQTLENVEDFQSIVDILQAQKFN